MDTVQCDTLTLGSLVRGFEPLGLWTGRPHPSEVFMSVSKFTAALCNILIHTYPVDASQEIASFKKELERRQVRVNYQDMVGLSVVRDWNPKPSIHNGCNFKKKFDTDIQEIMANIPSAVLDSHLRHMEEQSKK